MTADPRSLAEIFQGGQVKTSYCPPAGSGWTQVGEISEFVWHEDKCHFEISFSWLVRADNKVEPHWVEIPNTDTCVSYGQFAEQELDKETNEISIFCDRIFIRILPPGHKDVIQRPII